MSRARLVIAGRVQGVGYRYWLLREATRLGLRGWARNRRDGSVEAVVEGPDEAVEEAISLSRHGPPGAVVKMVEISETENVPILRGFQILPDA